MVIEGVKARKANREASAPNAADGSTTTASTVDIDAVSVK